MIILGDSREELKKIENGSIDLTVTSPPYDGIRDYNGAEWNLAIFREIADELYRVTKKGGVVVWIVADQTINGSETGTSFKQALYFMDIGFRLHDTMIYLKRNPVPLTHRRQEQAFEYMFVLSKGRPKTFNGRMEDCKHAGDRTDGRTFYQRAKDNVPTLANKSGEIGEYKLKNNVWEYATGGIAKGHPAQFPLSLATDHILTWSNKGDLVLDPFLGAGTTGVAAKNEGRKFIGIEIDKSYYNISKKTITEHCEVEE